MGRTYLRTLSECRKHGTVFEIRCPACSRVIYSAPDRLSGVKLSSGDTIREHAYVEQIEPLLRCRGGAGTAGCGHKGAYVRVLWPHEVPGIPKGVPIIEWLNGDDRERMRLVRQARG